MDLPAKPTLLVVDDLAVNIDVLTDILNDHYRIIAALSGEAALKICQRSPQPDLVLLDVNMPGMSGYQLCAELQKNTLTAHLPVIFVTTNSSVEDEQRGFELGAVDYIAKPVSPPLVRARVKNHIALHNQSRHLEQLVQQRTEELNDTRLEIIRRLGLAAEFKDVGTGMHIIRMSWYSRIIAEQAGMSPEWCELLYNAAPMHDIGKIGIPDKILLKPAKLDAQEWETMRRHSEFGAQIIGDHDSPILVLAKEIALHHHEKWDGSGYPYGLKGEQIPLSARIVALADVCDALASKRPYKEAWDQQAVVDYVTDQAGKHFDPDLVPHLLEALPRFEEIQQRYQDPPNTH